MQRSHVSLVLLHDAQHLGAVAMSQAASAATTADRQAVQSRPRLLHLDPHSSQYMRDTAVHSARTKTCKAEFSSE